MKKYVKKISAVRQPYAFLKLDEIARQVSELDYRKLLGNKCDSGSNSKSKRNDHSRVKRAKKGPKKLSKANFDKVAGPNEPTYVKDYKDYELKLLSLDYILNKRVSGNYYFHPSQLYKDIVKLCSLHLKDSEYCDAFLRKAKKVIDNQSQSFIEALKKDWEDAKACNKNIIKYKGEWKKSPYEHRKYTTIWNYEKTQPGISNKLMSKKKPKCDGEGCKSFEEFGEFSLAELKWNCSNLDRKRNVECWESCPCGESCKNRQIAKKEYIKLGSDVKAANCWGFDIVTFRYLLAYMMLPQDLEAMKNFISGTLPKAINSLCEDNWNILCALKEIKTNTQPVYTLEEKRYAKGLINAIKGLSLIYGEEKIIKKFRVHPKGKGIVCERKEGIKKNSLIVEYFGELYRPAKWYEKQDILKHNQNKNKASKKLHDFYNMMLEMDPEDDEGFGLLIVDPIARGNYASRFSHSCNPNCESVNMVSNGKYTIGIYAIREINYLEELTINYYCFTENSQEHKNSICFCSTSLCNGLYLALASNSTNILPEHNFLHRIAIMLEASEKDYDKSMKEITKEYGIKRKILEGCPEWLEVWVALIVQKVIQKEEQSKIEREKKFFKDCRIRDLAINIDKIKYCFDNTRQFHAPLKKLTEREVLEHLWTLKDSINSQVKTAFPEPEVLELLAGTPQTVVEAKMQLLKVRDLLRTKERSWKTHGVADMLHFICFTRNFFVEVPYKKFCSEKVEIRYCDLGEESKYPEEVKFTDTKEYSKTFIHGVLAGWFKQSVENPQASLSSLKRGTVVLPNISKAEDTPYTEQDRLRLLQHIKEKPDKPWPKSKTWKFFNYNLMGSPWFDDCYLNTKDAKVCLEKIDAKAEDCRSLL